MGFQHAASGAAIKTNQLDCFKWCCYCCVRSIEIMLSGWDSSCLIIRTNKLKERTTGRVNMDGMRPFAGWLAGIMSNCVIGSGLQQADRLAGRLDSGQIWGLMSNARRLFARLRLLFVKRMNKRFKLIACLPASQRLCEAAQKRKKILLFVLLSYSFILFHFKQTYKRLKTFEIELRLGEFCELKGANDRCNRKQYLKRISFQRICICGGLRQSLVTGYRFSSRGILSWYCV